MHVAIYDTFDILFRIVFLTIECTQNSNLIYITDNNNNKKTGNNVIFQIN